MTWWWPCIDISPGRKRRQFQLSHSLVKSKKCWHSVFHMIPTSPDSICFYYHTIICQQRDTSKKPEHANVLTVHSSMLSGKHSKEVKTWKSAAHAMSKDISTSTEMGVIGAKPNTHFQSILKQPWKGSRSYLKWCMFSFIFAITSIAGVCCITGVIRDKPH